MNSLIVTLIAGGAIMVGASAIHHILGWDRPTQAGTRRERRRQSRKEFARARRRAKEAGKDME